MLVYVLVSERCFCIALHIILVDCDLLCLTLLFVLVSW